MATPAPFKYHLNPFWDDEFKRLDYIQEPFNDPLDVTRWLKQGYQSKVCGDLCDMRHKLPTWNDRFIEYYDDLGWKDIGVAYGKNQTQTKIIVYKVNGWW